MSKAKENLSIDLSEVWNTLIKDIGFVKKATIITTLLAAGYVYTATPVYESQALIRVKQEKGFTSSLLDDSATGNNRLSNTYQEILKSRSVVIPMIKKVEKPNDKGNYPSYESYANSKITTRPYKDTDMVMVSVKASSAEKAQKANEALLEAFLDRLTQIDRSSYSVTRKFLEGRLVGAKEDLYKAEDKLNDYRKEHRLLTPDNAVKLVADKMALTDRLKAQNMIDREAAAARVSAVDNVLQENTTSIADNASIRYYNDQIAKLEAQRVEFATKYTAKHPSMVKINQDIAELQGKLDKAINQLANGKSSSTNVVYNGLLADKLKSEAEANVAASNLATIEAIEAKDGEDFSNLSDNQKEFLRLMRDAQLYQEIYTMLSKRLEEAKVAEVSISRNVAIVDEPVLPTAPIAPKKTLTIVLAFLLGLLGSSAFVVGRGMLNNTIKTSEDIEKYLEIPVLGQVPSLQSLEEVEKEAEMNTIQKIWRVLWKK